MPISIWLRGGQLLCPYPGEALRGKEENIHPLKEGISPGGKGPAPAGLKKVWGFLSELPSGLCVGAGGRLAKGLQKLPGEQEPRKLPGLALLLPCTPTLEDALVSSPKCGQASFPLGAAKPDLEH